VKKYFLNCIREGNKLTPLSLGEGRWMEIDPPLLRKVKEKCLSHLLGE